MTVTLIRKITKTYTFSLCYKEAISKKDKKTYTFRLCYKEIM